MTPRNLRHVERSVLQGLTAFRWAAWLWMTTVLLVARRDLARPWLAVGLVLLALAVTVADTFLLRTDHRALLRPVPLAVELATGTSLVLADGWAYAPGHAFSTSQSLGSVWPLAGVLATGLAAGPVVAALAGVGLGLARAGAAVANAATHGGPGSVAHQYGGLLCRRRGGGGLPRTPPSAGGGGDLGLPRSRGGGPDPARRRAPDPRRGREAG